MNVLTLAHVTVINKSSDKIPLTPPPPKKTPTWYLKASRALEKSQSQCPLVRHFSPFGSCMEAVCLPGVSHQ